MNDEYICDDRNYGISEKYKNMTEEEIEEEFKKRFGDIKLPEWLCRHLALSTLRNQGAFLYPKSRWDNDGK